ncbi:hypothetical protein [Intestinimonas sp.]|uniref:hypothetical protein n=1 Tax=Intestinimonas sp. TaxID=1965293 RepID=UPI002632FFF0|nr:hypothetical protein [Intestinimonas sp.]
MTEHPFQRRVLKLRAKRTFFRFLRPCLICTFFLLILSMTAQFFSMASGGTLFYTFLPQWQFPVATGVWRADATAMTNLLALMGLGDLGSLGGVIFALRLDELGQVLVLPVAWKQVIDLVVIQAVVLLVTAPLLYGVLGQYRSLLEGRPLPLRAIFRWYADLRLTVKALAVQVILNLWRLVTILLCALPGIFCAVAGNEGGNMSLLLLAMPLSIAGMVVSYCLYLLLTPATYVLVRSPELSVGQAFSRGLALLGGRQGEYCKLNLSFLLWHLLGAFLYGAPNLFVVPYVQMSNFLFLDPPPEPEEFRTSL